MLDNGAHVIIALEQSQKGNDLPIASDTIMFFVKLKHSFYKLPVSVILAMLLL